MSYSIAIDGPAGAGKSTIAKKIAKKKGFIYVDTGAMYRAMALYLIRKGIEPSETEKISKACKDADITISYENGEQIVWLNGENVNPYLRTEEVGNMASVSSANMEVRKKFVKVKNESLIPSFIFFELTTAFSIFCTFFFCHLNSFHQLVETLYGIVQHLRFP